MKSNGRQTAPIAISKHRARLPTDLANLWYAAHTLNQIEFRLSTPCGQHRSDTDQGAAIPSRSANYKTIDPIRLLR